MSTSCSGVEVQIMDDMHAKEGSIDREFTLADGCNRSRRASFSACLVPVYDFTW